MTYILPFLIAMIVCMLTLPVFARVAAKWRIVDEPNFRKVHVTPIPRVGGIAMLIGVLVAALTVIPLETSDGFFLGAALIVAAFGALDDRFDLDPRVKLLGQLLAAGIVVLGGNIQIHALTLDDRMALQPWLSIPLTVVFLVGITNAINLADGLDGLAGGTTFLCLGALAILGYSGGHVSATALALTFAGAVLGFLRFNTYPASIFMGDAGSQLLGFAVGVLSLRATQSGNDQISAATPILLLALPILDTLSVSVQRISEGRSPFSADKNHIHHKLLALGFHHHEAVMAIYVVQASLFVVAYTLRYESDLHILAAVSVFFVMSLVLLQLAARGQWHLHAGRLHAGRSRSARSAAALLGTRYLPRWSLIAVAGGLVAYAAMVTVETARLGGDVRLLLSALLAVTVIWFLILRMRPLALAEKAALYVTAAVLVYLDTLLVQGQQPLMLANWGCIGLAAAGTFVRLWLTKDRRFELTPLDLIILFVALVVPALDGGISLPHGGALGIVKLVIIFYALEVLVSRIDARVVWLRCGVATVLVGLIVRPLL